MWSPSLKKKQPMERIHHGEAAPPALMEICRIFTTRSPVSICSRGLGASGVNICEWSVTDDCSVAFICAGEAYMKVRPLQVHRENEDLCLCGIHVSVLVCIRAERLNTRIFIAFRINLSSYCVSVC